MVFAHDLIIHMVIGYHICKDMMTKDSGKKDKIRLVPSSRKEIKNLNVIWS